VQDLCGKVIVIMLVIMMMMKGFKCFTFSGCAH